MTELVERTLGRYEIVSLLGKGGMGEVYRARDTELGREVAVKVLPEATAKDHDRIERFRREARAVAQLSHPNILDIHDFGTEDGVTYAVTELLEGSDLGMCLMKRSLPLSSVLKIGRAVAEGLAAAHNKGIVHRDVKPANIFVTASGQVKILDFGIARLKGELDTDSVDTEAETQALTQPGQILGTTAYMSPEQVTGGLVDARSDIFSLGCVLYEMLTDHRAFDGENAQDTMIAIATRDPAPIAESRPDVPPALEMIIRRCLEKQPAERFESARDVAFALEALADTRMPSGATRGISSSRKQKTLRLSVVGAAAVVAALAIGKFAQMRSPVAPEIPEKRHVVIMSFGAVGEQQALKEAAAGLTRVVASGLSLIEQGSRGVFWVVPICEAEQFGATTAQEAFRIFRATIAVTGRLQRSGDILRLDLEAIDPATGLSLRHVSIEDSVSNLSSFQEEPILRIGEMLGLPVTPEARERLASMATTMPEGFESYLRGLGIVAAAGEDRDLDSGIEMLESATALDPLFTAGRVALGRAYLQKWEDTGTSDWIDRAEEEAARAIRDGRWPERAYDLIAEVYSARGQQPEALSALEEAARIAPASAEAHLKLAGGYQDAGRSEDSERHIQRAVFLRPGYWPANERLAKLYLQQGRYEAAANQVSEVIAFAPQLTRGYNLLGAVLSYMGRADEARETWEISISIEPSRSALSNLGTLYFDDRRFADAAAMFERALDEDDSRYLTWGNLAYAYRYGPAPDKADSCFFKAVELGEKLRETEPKNLWVVTDLAAYNAMLGRRERGFQLLEQAVAAQPQDPQLIAQIAETFEDLGDRDQALAWVARSLDAGVSHSRFENRPTLRELAADERYQQMVREKTDHS